MITYDCVALSKVYVIISLQIDKTEKLFSNAIFYVVYLRFYKGFIIGLGTEKINWLCM